MTAESIRNIAIIAHVDHGKTTLVDQLFRQSGLFRENQAVEDRLMDSMDLERERGITISAKNCAVRWGDVKINILDTPGHADFGGEVERALQMVDGAVLLVDSAEGPMPQTRFVLSKALKKKMSIIVVINKMDRKDARVDEVLNEIYDLFIDLGADEDQIDFPVLYAIGREGIASLSREEQGESLAPLFECIVKTIPEPTVVSEKAFSMQVLNVSHSEYLGRLSIGQVISGTLHIRDPLVCIKRENKRVPLKLSKMQVYQGVTCEEVDTIHAGEIAILAGAEIAEIGDTIAATSVTTALPRIEVEEPTISMVFMTNTSPLSGTEGKLVQPQKIWDRLVKETQHNVAMRVEKTGSTDSFIVKGRGEFQMAILIETMRREGFELAVGRPQVILKEENGETLEPIEELFIDCPEEFIGAITEKLAQRKGRMLNMVNNGFGRVRLTFSIPSRGLIGYRNEFLTDTKGTGILSSILLGYEPHRGQIKSRLTGSLVSDREGSAIPYALFNLEPRGKLFISPGSPVYGGMVMGEHNRDNDLFVNPTKTKKLTNVRASGRDDNVILTPVTPLTLEQSIDFIRDDEIVEVTPNSIRMRKRDLKKRI
jgi:GTP-binding protein